MKHQALHVKFCGLTTLADALAAVEAGADYLGFNFYAKSPRCIAPADCRAMIEGLRERGAAMKTVGIFVEQGAVEIGRILNETGLDLAQLHGNHQLAELAALRGRAFMAVRDPAGVDVDALASFSPGEPAFLLDANAPGRYGGTGHTANWDAARPLAARFPLLLAGGLTPANVADAIRAVQPWGVDVASGVEAAPGRKDTEKMRAFVAAVRAAQGVTALNG
jgi:phosphoribosylanthranilate isomerase